MECRQDGASLRENNFDNSMLKCLAGAHVAHLLYFPFRGVVKLLLKVQLYPVMLVVGTVAVNCHEDPAKSQLRPMSLSSLPSLIVSLSFISLK